MKISESLRRKTIEMAGGVILNYFKIKRRRDTFYFGDIPASYFLLCEKNGFGGVLREIGCKWMKLYFSVLIPDAFRRIPPEDLLNGVVKKIWINLGLMSGYYITRKGRNLTVETRDEGMTELIGRNAFLTGFHQGVLSALYRREVEITDILQTRKQCSYGFRITNKKSPIEGKRKEEYNRLNRIQLAKDITLKDMLRKRLVSLEGNKMYFRGRILYPIENTAIHLFSNQGPLLESVPRISREFFGELLKADSGHDEKMRLLRNLLQAMGWGVFSVARERDSLRIRIDNPPYGLQKEDDNWDFLIKMIHGYVMAVDGDYTSLKVKKNYRVLNIGFSR